MNQRKGAAVLIGTIVLASAAGWIAARGITSPAEVAARTAAPVASPILVPVEERQLSTNVVVRGTGRFGSPQKLTIATSTLKPNSGIVSDSVLSGTSMHEGDLVLTASGRPVFLLVGARPMSRDLGGGTTGDDVRQLEQALARLGFDPGPIDGVFDERTESAVSAFYARAGFAAFGPTAEQLTQLRARSVDLVTTNTETLVAADGQNAALAKLIEARGALDDALARAHAAPASVERAIALAAAQERSSTAEISAARAARDAIYATAPTPPPVELATADRDLVRAQTAADSARLNGQRDIADATVAAAAVDRDAVVKRAALASVERALVSADNIAAARVRLAQLAQDEADRARRSSGIQVPADEVIFVVNAPVRVSELLVSRGDQIRGAAMVVTDAIVSIDSGLAVDDVALVKVGMTAQIEELSLGIALKGVVKRIASSPGTNGVDGFHVYFETSVDSPPPNLPGASVRLTIAVKSTNAAVLAVPTSALTLTAEGRSRVQVQRNGVGEFVDVVPGLSANGYVEVTGELKKGDLVTIGVEQKRATGA